MKRFAKMTALCLTLTLLAALFCAPAQALGASFQSHNIVSNASVGEGSGKQTTLVDFTTSDLGVFGTLGNIAAPTFAQSGAWGSPVLYTWLDSAEAETGIRGTLPATSQLANADTLSIQLLAQYTKSTNYKVTLQLSGTDKNGAPLTLEASTTASAANWQTVTFDVSAFVSLADPDAPCTVTVLTSTDAAESEQFVLWVRSLYTSRLEAFPEIVIPVACAAVGFLLGFALFFVIYRATCKQNRRPRREVY